MDLVARYRAACKTLGLPVVEGLDLTDKTDAESVVATWRSTEQVVLRPCLVTIVVTKYGVTHPHTMETVIRLLELKAQSVDPVRCRHSAEFFRKIEDNCVEDRRS
jgi:hypothetical protein